MMIGYVALATVIWCRNTSLRYDESVPTGGKFEPSERSLRGESSLLRGFLEASRRVVTYLRLLPFSQDKALGRTFDVSEIGDGLLVDEISALSLGIGLESPDAMQQNVYSPIARRLLRPDQKQLAISPCSPNRRRSYTEDVRRRGQRDCEALPACRTK
jgi:hypothetical protein